MYIIARAPMNVVCTSILLLLLAASCGRRTDVSSSGQSNDLHGLFGISAGECSDGGVTGGSYFRMITIGGNPDSGPFVTNNDSPCGDKTFTPLEPGSDGGLLTGRLQPLADPPFDSQKNGTAAAITEPQAWFAVKFAISTNSTDPQSGTEVAPPSISVEDGKLTGDLRSYAASWNGTHFNQGAPKPDGSAPGNTLGPEGAYDQSSGEYILDWRSQIVEGPFNNFTGVWHLEGKFEPQAGGIGLSPTGFAAALSKIPFWGPELVRSQGARS